MLHPKLLWLLANNELIAFYRFVLIENGITEIMKSQEKERTWSLSTKTALTPSAKSCRREVLNAMRYSVFITLVSCVCPNASTNARLSSLKTGKLRENANIRGFQRSSKSTIDSSPSFFPTAEATFEKYFCVKQSENGAPFPRPWRASLAHSATRKIGKKEYQND